MFDIRVRLGAVLDIDADDRLLPSDGPVRLWVTGVRLVVNRPPHDEWIWVEGVKLSRSGRRGAQTQILVRASKLPPSGPAGEHLPEHDA
ncbi:MULTISPECIES: hypothetical protein [Micromonospora]|uniref:Uncharacterized protein n=1 Tax=Micromonospora carbonacea TaxID=47853 RepID=A0A1C4YWR4_9ACTN|nr:hypothetical protein [Micromonospora carbonacea]MDI5936717.1 hypothetical protein [Micromonospora sp. DH15]OON32742.1 hypothetical protein BSA16_03905 [Micromonospora sp. Rc5]SCF25130.1 hypothetical protein GA0070563_10715 [Micromonospora carbonacea]